MRTKYKVDNRYYKRGGILSTKKKCLLLVLCLSLCWLIGAMAEGDVEEVTITIVDSEGNVIVGEPTPAPPTPTPAPTVNIEEPVYLIDGSIELLMTFGGDTTIGENVQSRSKSIFERELEKQDNDINFPFRNVKDIFMLDDFTMVNFEGTLTTAGRNPAKRDNDFLFRADPSYVSLLSDNGVNAVALENNHVMDMGEKGLKETKEVLLNAKVPYASENEPAILTIKGIKLGLLAYQTFGGRHDEIIDLLPDDIKELRDQGCDLIIINYHWGAEMEYAPNEGQIKLGRASIDAGADLVIGHHSHRINPIEFYKDRYIVYSLGNLSFAGNTKPADMSTFIFQIRVRIKNDEIIRQDIKIIPSRISSQKDYNDFAVTPYDKGENIEAVIKVMTQHGRKLEYAITDYPTQWYDEDDL